MRLVCKVAIFVILGTLSAHAQRQPKVTSTATLFKKVLPELRRQSSVPPRLPRRLVLFGESAHVQKVSRDYYEVIVGFSENCEGQHWCAAAVVTGKKTSQLATGRKVILANGTVGYYEPFECGAYCGNAIISWREGRYLYTLEIKGGEKREMLAAANSAAAN